MIDLYCERTEPGLWAEPLNAASNVAFLLAAALAFRRWRRAGANDMGVLALILVVLAVGLGSLAFHTLATRAALLADIIPIAVFIYGYFLLALRRFLRLSIAASLAALAAFAAFSTFAPDLVPRDFINQSTGYLPALGALIVIGILALRRAGRGGDPAGRADDLARAHSVARALLVAAGMFAVSLVFRSIDLAICRSIPIGTHFLWHGLNAGVLYVLLRAAVDWRAKSSVPRRL